MGEVIIETMSVLFTDVVGSTEMRTRLGEERADAARRAHDQLLTDAVAGHRGTVVKGVGDGVLATFLAAADAVAAAVAMQQTADTPIRIGISSGDVSREDGDVFGVPVVEASRLCDTAIGGEILVADLVRALSRGRGGFTFEPIGDVELKGIPSPVSACRVLWVPLAAAAGETSPIPLPPLLEANAIAGYVGRRDVIDSLRATWQAVSAGAPRAVLLAGEPGIGKTRTAAEVARLAQAGGATVLYGRCDEDLGVPYQPFVEALDHFTAHGPRTDLGRLPGELSRLLPELRERAPGLPAPVATDPRSEEHRLFEAVTSWLVTAARGDGLVLVLDDLHWATKPTLLLLLHLLRAAVAEPEAPRLLVLATYRDTDIDRAHPLSGLIGELRRLPGVARISLEGLTQGEITAFLAQQAGHDLDDDALALAAALYAETEGNPFFISEVLRHLVEVGQVRRQGDRWAVTDPERIAVPEGVRDVVGRRVSRLTERANAALSIAAVIGREVHLEILGELVDGTEDELVDALDEAVRARLLEEVGPDRYRFGHALVRTTLYDELSATRRRRLHRRVADVLEKHRPDDVIALSYHTVEAGPEGGDLGRAVRYTLAAAAQAFDRRAVAEAQARYRHVLELLEDGYDDHDPLVIQAMIGLGAAQRDGSDPEFRATLLTAARRAAAAGETDLLVQAVLTDYRGMPSIVGGMDEERVQLTEQALRSVGDAATPDRARLLAHLAAEISFGGDEARRLRLADEAREVARAVGDESLLAWVTVRLGYALFSPRRTAELVRELDEVAAVVDAGGDPALRIQVRLWIVGARLSAGDVEGVFAAVDEGLSIAEQFGVPFYGYSLNTLRTWQHAARGELDEASAMNDATYELGQRLGAADAFEWWQASLAPIAWLSGRAGTLADAAGELAAKFPATTEWRAAQVWWLALDGRRDEAREVLRRHPIDLAAQVDRPFPLHTLFEMAWISVFLDDAALAAEVDDLLGPFEGQWPHYFAATAGSVRLVRGLCAGVRGELDDGIDRLEDGLAELARLGFDALAVTYQLELARLLVRRGGAGDSARAAELLRHVEVVADRCGLQAAVDAARRRSPHLPA